MNTKSNFSKYHSIHRINAPESREFFDLDDAAAAVFGKGTVADYRIKDLNFIKNETVIADLISLGYEPNEFKPVQYMTHGIKGNNIMTVFELEGSDGGIYFGPHESSENWK